MGLLDSPGSSEARWDRGLSVLVRMWGQASLARMGPAGALSSVLVAIFLNA